MKPPSDIGLTSEAAVDVKRKNREECQHLDFSVILSLHHDPLPLQCLASSYLKIARTILEVTAHIGVRDNTPNRGHRRTLRFVNADEGCLIGKMLTFAGWLLFLSFPLNQLFLSLNAVLAHVEVKIRWMHFRSNYHQLHITRTLSCTTSPANKKKEDMWCWMTLFCFVLFSVLNFKHAWQILSRYLRFLLLGLCVCVWSIVFVPNMAALNLGKHFYLPKQSSACYTKRLITVFWLLLCQSVHHCWRGLEQKKPPPAHFTASLSKCTCKENPAQRKRAACRSSVCTRNNRRVG